MIQRPKAEDYWLNIGAAFPHEDGQGYKLLLQAVPLHGSGKLVMRAYGNDFPIKNGGLGGEFPEGKRQAREARLETEAVAAVEAAPARKRWTWAR